MTVGGPRRRPLFLRRDILCLPLVGEEGLVGRDPERVSVVVGSTLVSRCHAAWRRLDGEVIEIRDAGSVNGTFIDGDRIGEGWTLLRVGHQVDFGTSGVWTLTHEAHQEITRQAGDLRLGFAVLADGGARLVVTAGGRVVGALDGMRADVLMVLAVRYLEGDGAPPARRGWMDRHDLVRCVYGGRPVPRGRFNKLMFDTRAALNRLQVPDCLETEGERVRLIPPPGGIGFEG